MLHKVPDTKDVLDLLINIEHKWENIGKVLGVSESDLIAAFQDNDNRSRLSSVLTSWNESKSTPTTWETIIDVMGSLEYNSIKTKIQQFLTKQEVYSKYARMKDFVTIEAVPLGKLFIFDIMSSVVSMFDILIYLPAPFLQGLYIKIYLCLDISLFKDIYKIVNYIIIT